MSTVKTSRTSKKNVSLDKCSKENVCSKPGSLPQKNCEKSNEIQGAVNENGMCASEKSKKKKKKKKKGQANSTETLTTEDGNSVVPDETLISSDVEQKLAKLPELDVIKLPPNPNIEENVEDQPPNATSDSCAESVTIKKKKKKKKKKSKNPEGANEEATKPSQNFASANLNSAQPPVGPSFLKMNVQDSPVLLVSTLEKLKKNDTSNQKLLEQNAVAIADISQEPKVRLMKQPISMQNAEFNLQQIASRQQLLPPANSVTLTLIGENSAKIESSQMQSQLPSNSIQQETFSEKGEANAVPQKTKAQLKAERRALQEAQRAAKEVNKKTSGQVESKPPATAPVIPSKSTTFQTTKSSVKIPKESQKVGFFSHLPQFKSTASLEKHLESDEVIHPAVIAIGAQYAKENVTDSNACCIGILAALKKVIEDYKTPPNKEMSRDLGAKIEMAITFLAKCRPLSVGTLNALKLLKLQIGNIPIHQSDDKAKESICEQIDKFVKDSISLAGVAISKVINKEEIKDGDIILTYAYSSVVRNALYQAHTENKSFKVVVVDSRPAMEGKEMLRCLVKYGIPCSYALISALTYAMNKVTKVIVGAYAVRASGYVMSRIGSSQIALLAASRNIPFLVCCETYKSCERALIDSFVDNELGDPRSFVRTGNSHVTVLENWKEVPHLDLLNLLYDVTPPHLVSKLITEKSPLL